MTTPTPLTYRDAGVDIDAGNELVERIKPLVKRTFRPEVMGGLGGFGLRTAQWLIDKGARHLVLLGRRGPASAEAQPQLALWHAQGIDVQAVANVKIASHEPVVHAAVERLLDRELDALSRIAEGRSDADGAATTGINVARMRTFTFVLGGVLGAAGGILVTPLIGVDYQLGLNLTLKGFAAAVLGGLTNPLGAAVGGLTLGLVESLAIIGISSSYKDVVAFSVLIVIMILMPQGILGRAGRRGG